MLTMTMVETLETQMLDYQGETDYSMTVIGGPASSEWMPVESAMDDDSLNTTFDPSQHTPTVEIDMDHYPEQNDEEMTEYEMADEGGALSRGDGDEELPDAEILDASPIPLPVIDVAEGISAVPSIEFEHPSPLIVASQESFSEPPPPTNSHVHIDEHPSETVVAPPSQEFVHVTAEHDAIAIIPPHDLSHSSVSPLEHPAEHRAESTPQPTLQPTPLYAPEFDKEDPSPDVSGSESKNPEDVEEAPATLLSDGPHLDQHGEGTHFPESSEIPVAPDAVVTATEPQQLNEILDTPEALVRDPVTAAQQEQQETTSSGDPHEISEGVYIDPPPAVLLSLSPSSVQHEYSLFNQPIPASRERTAPANATTDQPPTFELLLHQRPTLYYEPLSAVFLALREEEAIYSIPELVEGELVIDAYDLQLVIHEDNAHVQEVTLHELNAIHDGSDLQGPLRLRLYVNAPRFYPRYIALRDQIASLHLVDDDDDTFDDLPGEYPLDYPEFDSVDTSVGVEDVPPEEGDETQVLLSTPVPLSEQQPEADSHSIADIDNAVDPNLQTEANEAPSDDQVVAPYTNEEPDEGRDEPTDLGAQADVEETPEYDGDLVNEAAVVHEEAASETPVNAHENADVYVSPESPYVVEEEYHEEQVIDLTNPDVDASRFEEDATEDDDEDTISTNDPKLSIQDEDGLLGTPALLDHFEEPEPHSTDIEHYQYNEENADLEDFRDDSALEAPAVPSAIEELDASLEDQSIIPGTDATQEPSSTGGKHALDPHEADEDGLFDWDDDEDTQTIMNMSGQVLDHKPSSETISNRSTKRSIDEVESGDENDQTLQHTPPVSPDSKRARVL